MRNVSVLFLTTVLPSRRRMGSEVASQAIIDELLALGADVSVAGYVRQGEHYTCAPHEVCVGRRPIETADAGLLPVVWLGSSLLRGLPYSMAKYRSHAFAGWVRAALARRTYDLVVVDHLALAWLVPLLGPPAARIVGMMHNVEHRMYESLAREEHGRLRRPVYGREGRLLRTHEVGFAKAVDEVWVLTRSDATFFESVRGAAGVTEIPLATAATPGAGGEAKTCDVALIGSWSWRPNEEGLRWFLESVQPRLPADVTIHVAGRGASWLEGRVPNVRYLGFVDDAQQFLRTARVVAIPTLSGGGIQIKTLDAIASGSRIVATPIALRGIDDAPATVSVADRPEEFVARVVAALGDGASTPVSDLAVEWSRARQARFRGVLADCLGRCASSRPTPAVAGARRAHV